ncbi:MAG: calcium/sodium antiporter [Chloroflexota bacterium]|nr:MAG: sodium:calcium antiporter [Chloroflexota bacterium]
MEPVTIVLFLSGIGLLVLGAEMLVRGASQLAISIGISPLVVGLTVVAFGTSSPELAVSVQAALAGQGSIALGNVVGSNIANVLLILGLSALIAPLTVAPQLIRQDVPITIGVSLLVLLLALDGWLSRLDGALLIFGMALYMGFALVQARKESAYVQAEYAEAFGDETRPARRRWPLQLLSILVGLALLTIGAQWLVDGAVAFATAFGVSDLVIGLTIVAVGTSLPEIAASVVAGLRGERDIAVGNVIGSCLFNLLAVLGAASLAAPEGIAVPPSAVAFDLPVMLATAVACLPIFIHRGAILRWEGGLFLGYYVAYMLYLLLAATHHDLLGPFSLVMLVFVIPLTVVTIGVVLVRYLLVVWPSEQE